MRLRSGVGLEALLWGAALVFFLFGFGWVVRPARPFVPGPRPAGGLRVVTWNVGGSTPGSSNALLDEDLERVASVLRELDPDLCFLQELRDERQLGRLRRRLGTGWVDSVNRGPGNRRVAVLARRGELVDFELPGNAGRALGVEYRSEVGHEVQAVAVHADAFSSERRNVEIGTCVEELRARPGRHRLLVGDFNVDLDLDKRRDLFTDDEYLDVETYNFVALDLFDAGQGRGTTAEPDRRLDYVFFDSEGFELERCGPWKGQRVGSMDHDPVVADLSVR